MDEPTVRWLHITDIFATPEPGRALESAFASIEAVAESRKGRGFIPDLIIVTGDVAKSGGERDYL